MSRSSSAPSRAVLPLTSTLGLWLAASALAPAPAHAQAPADAPPAPAQEAPPAPPPPAAPPDLGARLDEIDQRARIADRKLEIAEEKEAVAAKERPVVAADGKGFGLGSADKANAVRFKGLVQGAYRAFATKALQPSDSFLVRKARPILEATLGGVADLRIMPDFAGSTAALQDAYGELKPAPWLKLRVGKFKAPVGLERLQEDKAVVFVDRGLPTAIAPNRDVGVQLSGDLFGYALYQVAVLNGASDGASLDADFNHAKDFAGRVFFTPFKPDLESPLQGLGFGVGGETGNQKAVVTATAVTQSGLSGYGSIGGQSFFAYATDAKVPTSSVVAKGRRTRLSPQLYYYVGPFGVLGEAIFAWHNVAKAGVTDTLRHRAYQALATLVLTGDRNSFEGVQVERPFDLKKGTWGALELAARYNTLVLDEATFPTFANPTSAVKRAQAAGVALNWHWSANLKLQVNFERTWFEGGAKDGDRPKEDVVWTQGQFTF